MSIELNSARKGPKNADSAIVFLHGYGADGADLLGLADPLAPALPGTAFFAPDAPESCAVNPMGFQWFPIPGMDGSSEEQAMESLRISTGALSSYLDGILTSEGLTPDRLAIVGFSQGTMMALHVLPRFHAQIAGIVGFSGRVVAPESFAAEVKVKPPVVLIHGDKDAVVPFKHLGIAAETLAGAGISVSTHVMKGAAHDISPDGLRVALKFLRECLAK